MSSSIHLCNGDILCDPEKGQFSRSLTIQNSLVTEIDATPPNDVQIIDLEDKVAVPGFIDSHLHLTLGAAGLGDVDLSKAHSKESFAALLLEGANQLPLGSWLIASCWAERTLGGFPDKTWLDELGNVPTVCFSLDLHTAIMNDSVIAQLDMDHILSMPGSEEISDGIIKEDALFEVVLPLIPHVDSQTRIARTRHALKKMHAEGITLVGTMENVRDIEQILVPLQEEEMMRCRVMCLDDPTQSNLQRCKSFTSQFLSVTGFKAFLDGSFGSRTAKMYDPWNDAEGDGVWAGVAANGTLNDWIAVVTNSNFSPVVHAIGDQAVGMALDAMAGLPKSLVSRIEHAQCVADQDLEKIGQQWFGIQPLHLIQDAMIAEVALNEHQTSLLHNWRRMVDAGAKLSFGSDWPVAPPEPISAMRVAIDNGLSVHEVLAMSTCFAAESLRTPKAGRLGIGCYGDVVILDRNPLICDWNMNIPSVIMTILGGKLVYQREIEHA